MRPDSERVVITGTGVVSPIGNTTSTFITSLLNGTSAISKMQETYDEVEIKIAGDCSDFNFNAWLSETYPDHTSGIPFKKLLRSTPPSHHICLGAAFQAYLSSGLDQVPIDRFDRSKFAHILTGHNLSMNYFYKNTLEYLEDPDFIDPMFGVYNMDTDILSVISEVVQVHGTAYTTGGACASGNIGLLNGLDLIRNKRANCVLVTGGSHDLSPVGLKGWVIIDAIAYNVFPDQPERASRPFDIDRGGFVPGMGSGAVILESLEHARHRGATILAELKGAAVTSSGLRHTRPDQKSQVSCMNESINDAQIEISDINYINAHATSTPLGDKVEVESLKQVFSDHIYNIPTNATKSMTGHCLSSAGMVELIAIVHQMQQKMLHPTINLDNQDPELDLDFVPHKSRSYEIKNCLSNSFGFGGYNACVVVGEPDAN